MKYEHIEGLRTCPMCGNEAHMRKNASKRFQIHCKKCRCCTAWVSKTMAVVMWYNNAEMYEALHGKKGGSTNDASHENVTGANQ